MKNKFWNIFLLVVMVIPVIVACGSDDDENHNNGSSNKTDVAVTGDVSKLGITYAHIEGYVNLNLITSTYSSPQLGIELSMNEEFTYPRQATSRALEGNKLTVVIDTLSGNTKYYYRTFVRINDLNYYGEKRSFTTKDFLNITFAGDASDLTSTTAKINCKVDASSIDRDNNLGIGVAYSISKTQLHPDSIRYIKIMNKHLDIIENNSYDVFISGLQTGMTYYYCSFTRAGSKYKFGEIKSFATKVDSDPPPADKDKTVKYILDIPMSPEDADDDAPLLKTIEYTESGYLLIEFYQPVSHTTVYFSEKTTLSDNIYTVNGSRMMGTIKEVSNNYLIINLTVSFSEERIYNYITADGETITVTKGAATTSDETLKKLARTWNVLGLILDLKGPDVKDFETWEATNGLLNLETTLLEEVLARDVSMTPEEQDELRKTVKSVTITKTKLFVINYTDAPDDVASWEWTDNTKTAIRITLKDSKMGSKFIENASLISFTFNGDRCNMKIATTFTDNANKQWDAIVTFQLQSPF